MVYIILITYLVIVFWGSLIGRTSINTPESYFLANRSLKTLGLFFTILATNFSAFYFLGFAGEGYKIGYSHYVIMALGTGLVGPAFFILGTKIWRLGKAYKYITPAELVFGQTRNRMLAVLFSLVMVVFTLPYLALQIVGGGYILENLTGGEISYALAIVLLTIFTIIYVIIGGMESVARTDLKQGLIVILFMVFAVILIGNDLGGIKHANEQAAQIVPDLFTPAGIDGHYTSRKWFSFIVFWFFCVPMFPQLFMRFYIAKDISVLKKSAILYCSIPVIISLLPVMIGVWGHISFPDLQAESTDQILPLMLQKHTSEIFSALIMTGAVSAFMSTLDSQLLAISTMVTRDFIIPFRKKQMDLKEQVKLGKFLVALFALIGAAVAYKPFATIFDMGKMAFSGLAILFPITLAITRFRFDKPIFGIIAILVGVILLLGFYYGIIPDFWAFGFEYFIIIIIVSFGITALGLKWKTKE